MAGAPNDAPINLAKVLASLNTVCTKCRHFGSPERRKTLILRISGAPHAGNGLSR